MQRKVYIAGENMKCKTPLESRLTLLIKNKDSHIFHSDINKNGKQNYEIQCMSLGKWLKNYDTSSSSVIEKNEWNPHQLDLAEYPASKYSRARKTIYQKAFIIGFHFCKSTKKFTNTTKIYMKTEKNMKGYILDC